ncbi:hypothetical protein PanWU01x14_364230 [Parasponia andersonii]|uniref:Transmembrane protein n=1 Tax=Parasponia andersonii TaxID=3476 RepID=A0A2P5A6C9_PARAD|nr:hypothetical protein PanWU01x14_364230 [Parasponia andersonii]
MALTNSSVRYYLRITLGVVSAILGLIFLSQSSFFKMEFDDKKSSKILVFAILSALLFSLVFVARSWSNLLQKVWNLNFSVKSMIDTLFLGIVWLLAFLIKYPRFDVHSKYRKSCVGDQGKEISLGSQYCLYSIGAFALLALLLSSDSDKTMELGLFSVLIGLTMDTSMEIPAYDDGPNLWYMLGAVLYCVGLIFLRRYLESLMGTVLPVIFKDHKRGMLRNIFWNTLELISAIVGLICLFLSPFFEQQFKDAENLKGVCFIAFALLLGSSLLKAPKFINILVMRCHGRYLVKAMVESFFFMIVSVVIFISKYPRFKIHSKYLVSCKVGKGESVSQGNQFDVYSTGSFSLFALTISSEKEQHVKLGIFSFLLELTMDTSIEILGNDGPSFLYMLGAGVYCFLLILVKSYLDTLMEKGESAFGQQESYHDRVEVSVDSNARDIASGDELPLIESKTGEEMGREDVDHELVQGEIDSSVAVEDRHHVTREYTDTGEEASFPYDVLSHMDDGSGSLNHRERRKAIRREKAKRERARRKENRIRTEDLPEYSKNSTQVRRSSSGIIEDGDGVLGEDSDSYITSNEKAVQGKLGVEQGSEYRNNDQLSLENWWKDKGKEREDIQKQENKIGKRAWERRGIDGKDEADA